MLVSVAMFTWAKNNRRISHSLSKNDSWKLASDTPGS